MTQTFLADEAAGPQSGFVRTAGTNEASASGASWAAVIAGGFVTAALSLILLALGAGLGLSSFSFWSNTGASAPVLGAAGIVWLILMGAISSAMGGYIAGRLRTKWTAIHSDEVYFRDTVHGLLSWSVALVVTAAFLGSAAASLAGTTTGNEQNSRADHMGYFVDALFRSDSAKTESASPQVRAEAERILTAALARKDISVDKTYLESVVAANTGLSSSDSDNRVSQVFLQAQQAADQARKNLSHSLLWAFLALLIGAFCASFAATIGGKQRDHVAVA